MFPVLLDFIGVRTDISGFLQSRYRRTRTQSFKNDPLAQSRYQGIIILHFYHSIYKVLADCFVWCILDDCCRMGTCWRRWRGNRQFHGTKRIRQLWKNRHPLRSWYYFRSRLFTVGQIKCEWYFDRNFLIDFLFELAGICGTITMTNESIFELRKECEIIKNTHLDVDQ